MVDLSLRAVSPTLTAVVVALGLAGTAHAQLETGYLGDEPGPKSWTIDVTTGEFAIGGGAISRAAAFDVEQNRSFSVVDARRSTDAVRLIIGEDGPPTNPFLFTPSGFPVYRVTALAYGNGVLYGIGGGAQSQTRYLATIDTETGIFTILFSESEIGGDVTGLTYDHDRNQLLAGIDGSIYILDPETAETEFVTVAGGHDGLAYGYNRIYMVCGNSNNCPDTTVYNRITESFEPGIPVPPRNGNGASGATFNPNGAVAPPLCDDPSCPGASNRVFVGKTDSTLQLSWEPECVGGMGYVAPENVASAVYRGDLRAGYGSLVAEPGLCGVIGQGADVSPGGGEADFFLVVPHDGLTEGSYGKTSGDVERTPSTGACFPQEVDNCANAGG